MNAAALLLALLLIAAAVPVVADTANTTTVILVRHAEKVDASTDPELSAEGVARAEDLVRVLRDTDIRKIYTTPFKRTRNTAAPIAKAKGIEPTTVAAGKTLAQTLAAQIREHDIGSTVLVVGHSNSVPDTMRALGVQNPPSIDDATEFDRLFIVTLVEGKEPSMVALRYGAAKSAESSCH